MTAASTALTSVLTSRVILPGNVTGSLPLGLVVLPRVPSSVCVFGPYAKYDLWCEVGPAFMPWWAAQTVDVRASVVRAAREVVRSELRAGKAAAAIDTLCPELRWAAAAVDPQAKLCRHCAATVPPSFHVRYEYPPSNHTFPCGIWHLACRQYLSLAAACEAGCAVGGRGPARGDSKVARLCADGVLPMLVDARLRDPETAVGRARCIIHLVCRPSILEQSNVIATTWRA